MDQCCAAVAPGGYPQRVLRAVFAVNAAMFAAELTAGLLARSTALLADSVDMLGDAVVYGVSLAVVARGPAWQARAALLKGGIMAAFALGVGVEVGLKLARGAVPAADVMGGVGLAALAANLLCLALLARCRDRDLNMRSAWLCSRNDVLADLGVLVAAALVGLTGAAWPDIAVGLAIAALFTGSAVDVLRDAGRHLRAHGRRAPGRAG